MFASCKDNGLNGGRLCTTEARAGINIEIRDAATSLPAARGAIAVVSDHSFVDTLRGIPFADSLTVFGVFERPGVYTVVITKSGYRDWTRSNVVVNKDECHVIPVQLDARLERIPL